MTAVIVVICAVHSRVMGSDNVDRASVEARVDRLLGEMNQEEKLSLLTGTGFATRAIPRLGIPPMAMADAGQGVRGGEDRTLGPATAFPSAVAMAATWDFDLLSRIGVAIGDEARNKKTGIQMMLGPAVNIQRSPLCGRDGEYFSEDPYLAGRAAVGFIQGMQGTGIGSCIKHFACNNEEDDRTDVNVRVGERALREIYLPAFEAGVRQGRVWAVMSSYNLVNGYHASANAYLLREVLKDGWGFDGVVMSDWGGVHQTDVAQYGNDLEMPGGEFATIDKLKAALVEGKLTQAAVDDSVRRILRTIVRTGLMDAMPARDPGVVNSPAHQALALETATKGIVLLKNDGAVLPIDPRKVHSIAVFGDAAQSMIVNAQGSTEVKTFFTVEFLDGIRARAGGDISVRYTTGQYDEPLAASVVTATDGGQPGFTAEYFNGMNLEGKPFMRRVDPQIEFDTNHAPWPGVPKEHFSARWTGWLTAPETGRYHLFLSGDDGYRVKVDGKTIMDFWRDGITVGEAVVDLQAGRKYGLELDYFQDGGAATAKLSWITPGSKLFQPAIESARQADLAVVCVSTGTEEGEGHDRQTMDLPAGEDELISAVAAANRNTVVVMNNGGPVTLTPWISAVPAVLETWFPGEEGGAALAKILFGDIDPSGKLPTTFGARREDYPDYGHFHGVNGAVDYAEGIYVGYRHFDKGGIEPVFPFGYGLSYTTFAYSNPHLSSGNMEDGQSVTASVEVTNTGSRAGDEVVELFVHDPQPRIDKPVRELKGFARLSLAAGQTGTAAFTLNPRDLAYFDVPGKQWKADAGLYDVEFAASSRDIRQKTSLKLQQTWTQSVPLSRQF